MDGDTPQPASAAMAEETADWYVVRTGGQLQKAVHGDGIWYLYSSEPHGRASRAVTEQPVSRPGHRFSAGSPESPQSLLSRGVTSCPRSAEETGCATAMPEEPPARAWHTHP